MDTESHKHRSSGFTLVELLVTIAIFSILVSLAAGGFVRAIRSEREVSAMMLSESNVSLALEEMAREMRTGYLFCHDTNGNDTCGCSSFGQAASCPMVEFYNANHEKVDYELQHGVLERSATTSSAYVPEPLTSNNVSVTYLKFVIYGNTEGDHWNPRITIAIGAQPNDSTVSWSTVNLETTISARGIDCTPDGSC
jgi:prepilin-type N-terminal cleavage/methylation domain-containing protein